ncbi:MAG: DUF2520 domain-containing protein [Flavobacteriales bacterium]
MNPYQTQTSPVIRKNQKIIAKHIELLHHEQKNIYRLISQPITTIYE